MALVPQVVDAVKVPVIAAGGIADGARHRGGARAGRGRRADRHGVPAAPEAKTSPLHRAALKRRSDNSTTLTNVFTGRPARGIVNRYRPRGRADVRRRAGSFRWPRRQPAVARRGGGQRLADFTPLWSGQAPTFAREMPTAAN